MKRVTKTFEIKQEDGWWTASTPAVDRDNDRVLPSGGQFGNFLKNPVMFFGHSYREAWSLIGRVVDLRVSNEGVQIKPEWREPANANDPMTIIRALLDQGLLRALSIGFRVLEWVENDHGGLDFTKWELLEVSLVGIPANQEAVLMMAKGLEPEKETPRGSVEKMRLSKRGRTLSARNEERLRTAADALQSVLAELGDDDEKLLDVGNTNDLSEPSFESDPSTPSPDNETTEIKAKSLNTDNEPDNDTSAEIDNIFLLEVANFVNEIGKSIL